MPTGKKQIFYDMPFALAMGPQRSGTSWLDLYMRSRADICMPADVKEIFYFDQLYSRDFGFYARHFEPAESHRLVMEVTTTAFDTPAAPGHIYNAFGQELSLLCPLRNPIDRSYSLYRHYLRYGLVRASLQEAVEQIPRIVTSSCYAEHYERWREQFPDLAIPVVLQEDLEADRDNYVGQVCRALGLVYSAPEAHLGAPYNVANPPSSSLLAYMAQCTGDMLRRRGFYKTINVAKKAGLKRLIYGSQVGEQSYTAMTEPDYAFLYDRLNSEIEKFESLLGHRIPQWHDTNNENRFCGV